MKAYILVFFSQLKRTDFRQQFHTYLHGDKNIREFSESKLASSAGADFLAGGNGGAIEVQSYANLA